MTVDRRGILTAGMALGAVPLVLAAQGGPAQASVTPDARGLNVTEFGAKPGSDDDQSAAIQRAIDAAAPTGTPVNFPNGIYILKKRLTTAPGAVLHGAGPGGLAMLAAASGEPVLYCEGGGAALWGLTFSGSGKDGPTALVVMTGSGHFAVENCSFVKTPGSGLVVERAAQSALRITHCHFATKAHGLRVSDAAAGMPAQIIGNQFSACGMQIGGDAIITGNVVDGAPEVGIRLGGSKLPGQILASSNMVTNSRIGIGVTVEGGGYALMTMNMIKGAKDGAIRVLDGAKPVGPDLAMTRSEAFRHVALYGNVSQP